MSTHRLSPRLGTAGLTLIAAILLLAPVAALAGAHTPEPGSKERKAICDALREHLLTRVASRKPPQPIVFKVNFLRVDHGYACFEGVPLLEDGSSVPENILPDVGYTMVLYESGSGWKVSHDLSRTDVPSDSEALQLRAELRDVPSSILPDFWRELLKR